MTPLKNGDEGADASRDGSCIPPLVHSLAVLYGSATGTAQVRDVYHGRGLTHDPSDLEAPL